MKIVLASGNAGKLAEFQELMPVGYQMIPQSELGIRPGPETGATFVENALQKARHAAAAGLPVLADDSGICVTALGGEPGIYSARYAGENASAEANNVKLLQALRAVPQDRRDAFFHCTLVFIRHADDPAPVVCQSNWHGRILEATSGDAGFGYDPVFFVPEHHCSAAELPPAVKNAISHRAKAARQWVETL